MSSAWTDNVKRTALNARVVPQGQLGTSGSVAWDFDHVGMIEAEPAATRADPEEAAIEAGAQDVEPGDEEGTTLFITEPATWMWSAARCPPRALQSCRPSWATNPRTP